jgi:dynein heavy chain
VPWKDESTYQKKLVQNVYSEVINFTQLKTKCQDFLEDYNLNYSQNRMTLVLFINAIEHITRYM